ncbi:MAG TPA: PAS domain-containing protein [Roseiflexaceae bacterium]|nr:PAS domain-containing protein [Roseiflexaceae bacterium]
MALRERIADQSPVSIQLWRQRLQSLYRRGAAQVQSDVLLSAAFEELTYALDALQTAEGMLHQQRQELLNVQAEQDLQIQRYKDLFDYAPAGYLVTSIDGAIRQANTSALALLETSTREIVGRSLAVFAPEGQRRALRTKIAQVLDATTPQEWVSDMCSWQGALLKVRLTVNVLHGPGGHPLALYWLMRRLDERDLPG